MYDNFVEEVSFESVKIYGRFFVDGEEFSKQSAYSAWSEDNDGMFSFKAGDVVSVELI
jgi:hypothetical protein